MSTRGFSLPRRGIIFILSAPSGAGKTTISRRALKRIDGLKWSVSLTTRAPRQGETEGVDYHFVSEAEFTRRRDKGELAEWALVIDHRYGTARGPLEDAIRGGRDILLDIDSQGAAQIRRAYANDTVTVFVLPPTFAELESRLRARGTEDEAAIERRLKSAREEAKALRDYDYLIINDDVERSLSRFEAIVEAERVKVKRLREEFAPWKS